MKNKERIKTDLKNYLIEASLSDDKNIKDNTLIFETGLLDSMGLLFLIEFLNENYKVEVEDEELNPENFETLNSIVDFVLEKMDLKRAS